MDDRATPAFVMAVPWDGQRADRARSLALQAPATIVWDEGWRDGMTTLARAFDLAATTSRLGGIFMEDDVRLCHRWRQQAEAVIAEHGTTPIQFFSMRKADIEVGSRLEPPSSWLMHQCFYLPHGVARAAASWFDSNGEAARAYVAEHEGDTHGGQDWAMRKFLVENGLRYWLHVPSLVQHEQWRSVIRPTRSTKRQSATFESGSESDAL